MAHRASWSDRVSARARRLIQDSGLSDHKLAELTDIPLTTFRRRKKGVNPWDTAQLESLAQAIKVTPYDLIPDEHARKDAS